MKTKFLKLGLLASTIGMANITNTTIGNNNNTLSTTSNYRSGAISYNDYGRFGNGSTYYSGIGGYTPGRYTYSPITYRPITTTPITSPTRPITGTTPITSPGGNSTSIRTVTKTVNGVTTTTIYKTVNGVTTVTTIVNGKVVDNPKPTPEVKPTPVVEPKPNPEVKPTPVVEPKPNPEVKPTPVVEPKPTPEVKPTPVVEPKPTPEVKPTPVIEPKPTPEVKPTPVIEPKPTPEVKPTPVVEPITVTPPVIEEDLGPIIIKPTNPIVTTPKPVAENIPTRGIRWNDNTRGYDRNDPNNKKGVAEGIDGSGVVVGVLDSGFNALAMQKDLKDKFGSRFINAESNNYAPSSATHGIEVAEMVGGNTGNGIAKGATIIGTDITITRNGKSGVKATADHYNALYNRGARIFNQSFGIDSQVTEFHGDKSRANYSPTYYGHQLDKDVLKFWKDKINKEGDGSLFVWAAGNERGDANSSLQGGLPYFEKDLEKGWINVVGLAARDGGSLQNFSWENRDPYSRAGVSKNWTISAMADYIFDINGRKLISSGSSFAAPAVTGTAALVKQKYPWMDGNLLKQTVLSTATDIGAAGVDDVYGWGLLDVEKATKGPAAFDSRLTADGGDAKMNVTEGTYTFDNDISGDVGLVKNGVGTLVLNGASTFRGDTTLNEGAVVINGKSYTSRVNVRRNATLGTNSTRLENGLNNEGTLVNNGNTAIEGNYVASTDSRLVSTLGSELKVAGEVELNNSTLELVAEKDGETQYVTKKGVTTNAISSNTAIKGDFSKVETTGLLDAKAEKVGDNEVQATISRKDINKYVAENNENKDEIWSNVADNLEQSLTALDEKIDANGGASDTNVPFVNKAITLQQTLATESKSDTLDSLSGQIYGSAQALTFQNSETVNKDLTNRLTMLGTLQNQEGGIWVSGIHGNGTLSEKGFGEGKTKTYAAQAGIDKKFGDNVILGASLNYSKSEAEFNRHGGISNADGIGASVYGRVGNENNPLYVQGRVGYGVVDSDVEREIILSETDRSVAKINHKDKVLSGYVETGYDIKKDNFTLTPFVGISHDRVTRGAFSEENSEFGLTADKETFSQTAGLVGLRASQGINWNNGQKTTLQGYVTHQNAFNDEDLSFNARYTGLNSQNFEVKGIGLAKNKTWVGVGALHEFTPKVAVYGNYDLKLEKGKGGNKGKNNVFSTGFRVNF